MSDKRNIGRGKIMSIPKGALVAWKELMEKEPGTSFLYSGMLDFFHRAVDIAGARNRGPGTHWQVLACIRSSPYWDIDGTIPGWGERRANCYIPSSKGLKWLAAYSTALGAEGDN